MIAPRKSSKRRVTAKHQEQFMKMLPVITRMTKITFRELDPEGKEEAVAEVVAHAYVMFAGLVKRGREALAFPSVLGMYGIKRVKVGRKAATRQNIRDVSSTFCQLKKGVTVGRIDKFDREEGVWLEAVVEDSRTPPPDQAAFRIDFPAWLDTLGSRDRQITLELAASEKTGIIAKRFGVSPGRISQLRRELYDQWLAFHGEGVATETLVEKVTKAVA